MTIGCIDAEKVRFAAHLLEGPAADWWDSYQITHPIEEMTWDLFQEGFSATHISFRVMKLKREEFFDLHCSLIFLSRIACQVLLLCYPRPV